MKRSGDVNLHLVKDFEVAWQKTNGSVLLAKGEATGSEHRLVVSNPDALCFFEDAKGVKYYRLTEAGQMTHTRDHETVEVEQGTYRQVPEREIDYFADGVVRRVVD